METKKICGLYKCKKNDPTNPKKPCKFKTDIRLEMVQHAIKTHGAVFSEQFLRKIEKRSLYHNGRSPRQ